MPNYCIAHPCLIWQCTNPLLANNQCNHEALFWLQNKSCNCFFFIIEANFLVAARQRRRVIEHKKESGRECERRDCCVCQTEREGAVLHAFDNT